MVDYICLFACIGPSLHLWDESALNLMGNLFALLHLVCKYFINKFCMYAHQRCWCTTFSFAACHLFMASLLDSFQISSFLCFLFFKFLTFPPLRMWWLPSSYFPSSPLYWTKLSSGSNIDSLSMQVTI